MTRHHYHTSRLLAAVINSPAATAANAPPTAVPDAVDSDFVVILAALLCALICVLGLVAVARCACLRRISAVVTVSQHSTANKGLKKKTILSLPKRKLTEDDAARLTDCAICLAEFVAGDEIRALPQCGHGFHVACIDMWLGSHSTCPSCRQILGVERCHKCGGLPASPAAASATAAVSTSAATEDGSCDSNDFLP